MSADTKFDESLRIIFWKEFAQYFAFNTVLSLAQGEALNIDVKPVLSRIEYNPTLLHIA